MLRRLSDFQLILDGDHFRINLDERSKRNPKTETDGRMTNRCTKNACTGMNIGVRFVVRNTQVTMVAPVF